MIENARMKTQIENYEQNWMPKSQCSCGGSLVVSSSVNGNSNEEIRRFAKASINLANNLQHKRTANFRDAALCAEATNSIVNIIAILTGRRDIENI